MKRLTGDRERPFHAPPPTSFSLRSDPERAARYEAGRALRERVPREAHAEWRPAKDRPDPVALLQEQAASRVPDLVPIRYGRMSASAFAFLRGAALVMAADLAPTPVSGLHVQLAGDAHVANFGFYASPERDLLFDVNDFDETLTGPFEWDVKRLAASAVVASRSLGHPKSVGLDAARRAAEAYRNSIRHLARMRTLDVWYTRIDEAEIATAASGASSRMLRAVVAEAFERDTAHALRLATDPKTGKTSIAEAPPLIVHRPDLIDMDRVRRRFGRYRRTLLSDRRALLASYEAKDVALKVVGVGSVGTRCYVVFLSAGTDDPLFLQVKEAQASVLERFLPKSRYRTHGERVVAGQRMIQAASDPFLGWGWDNDGHDYYWRQLRDWKGSFDVTRMSPTELVAYLRLCGATLAHAHARSGDPLKIAGYLGSGAAFERSVAVFAERYAGQTNKDLAELKAAIASGKIKAETGV
jgi:uncharacterized protein (DUF2252 family)